MAILSVVVWSGALGITFWGTWYALCQFNRKSPQIVPLVPIGLPPVSILKPLKGYEEGMEGNIESFFQISYPEFEIIFCVADEKDPAAEIVRQALERHPHVKATLMVGETSIGPNPKVNNLYPAYHLAKHDVLLISDSNVRVGKDYLQRLVPELTPEVGILTSVVAGTYASGAGGILEAAYLNTFYARWMHVSAAFGVPCVVGKSMLFRRSIAQRFGGIHILSRYINEDYMAGKGMLSLGFKVRIVRDPINQYIGQYRLTSFWSRHIRWGRIRKFQAPLAFFLEPLVGTFFSGIMGSWGANQLWGVNPLIFFGAHMALWGVCDFLLMRRLGPGQNLKMFFGWCLRELIAFPLWVHIACGNTVNWRGSRLTLRPGGLLATAGGI